MLTDLHIHVGGAVAPHILFSIAQRQGIKLPGKGYWDFVELITSRPEKVKSLEDYLGIMHQWTERIQSSPAAMERSCYEIIGKEHRSSRIDLIELRFNPMKRNIGGERDLDHIIHASIIGMERAQLDYGVEAGLIFCLAREFEPRLNEIIVEKAIKYKDRGVIGIDLAGTETNTLELDEAHIDLYSDLVARARDAGLGVTIHTGETPHTDARGVMAVIDRLKPHRIGHGIRAAYNPEVMEAIKANDIVLEICPTSNLHTRAVADLNELKTILRTFLDNDVKFTINTDGPYLLRTNTRLEIDLLLDNEMLTTSEVTRCFEISREASFIGR